MGLLAMVPAIPKVNIMFYELYTVAPPYNPEVGDVEIVRRHDNDAVDIRHEQLPQVMELAHLIATQAKNQARIAQLIAELPYGVAVNVAGCVAGYWPTEVWGED